MAKGILASLGALLAAPQIAQAASQAREDHSGLVVWAFLGFCALIIVMQLLPALLVSLGIVKGIARREGEQSEPQKSESHS